MKYYESKKSSGRAGFYTVIACCLIALGAATWFAVSRYQAAVRTPQGDTGEGTHSSNQPSGSRTDSGSSSLISRPELTPSDDVANSVSDVPYESEPEPVGDQSFIMPVNGQIIKGFSNSSLQFSATYGDMRLHIGTDILCAQGTAVKAAGDGTVTAVDESASLGRTVTIDHGNGIIIKYCGLNTVDISNGQKVAAGDPIGTAGNIPAECADQSHVHIEATRDGIPVALNVLPGLD